MNDERKAFEEWATDSAFNDFSTYDGEPFAYCNEFTDWAYRAWQARAAVAPPRERGGVVVTTNERGECIAVTRQDDEGRILSTIWLRAALAARGEKP
jgi:hypothetical protein